MDGNLIIKSLREFGGFLLPDELVYFKRLLY